MEKSLGKICRYELRYEPRVYKSFIKLIDVVAEGDEEAKDAQIEILA